MSNRRLWGVQLLGHPYDLADWAQQLTSFDPWVHKSNDGFVLRWSGFDELNTAHEVYEAAAFIVDQLNGAMAAAHGTRTVRYEGVVEFRPDGTISSTLIVAAAQLEARSRAAAVAVTIGPDGKELPPPPPQPSEIQQWMTLADADDCLAQALAHYARPGWYEAFKVIECLEDWAGGEHDLLDWLPNGEFKRLKRTANSFRHRSGSKHTLPPDPVTPKQARDMLAVLIRKAFAAGKPRE